MVPAIITNQLRSDEKSSNHLNGPQFFSKKVSRLTHLSERAGIIHIIYALIFNGYSSILTARKPLPVLKISSEYLIILRLTGHFFTVSVHKKEREKKVLPSLYKLLFQISLPFL